jgi:hypothetical protein
MCVYIVYICVCVCVCLCLKCVCVCVVCVCVNVYCISLALLFCNNYKCFRIQLLGRSNEEEKGVPVVHPAPTRTTTALPLL